MKKRIVATLIAALSVAFILSGCGAQESSDPNNGSSADDQLTVVTTFYPMFDFTRQVVQDHGDVSLLIPAGTEPHDFEPSAQMIAQIEDADVFVYNSDDMETWVPSALEAIDQDKVTIINARPHLHHFPRR